MKLKKAKQKRVSRSIGGDIFVYSVLGILALFMALPLIYVVCNAFKPYSELFRFPPKFFVQNPTLDNFKEMGEAVSNSWVPFLRYLFNTVYITVIGVVLQVIIATCAAYGLAKFDFPGRKLLFGMVVYALMFPAIVTSIPTYLIFSKLNMIDSHWTIILPALQSSMGLYLMKQFMEQSLPDALLEAARIDGAGELYIIFKIVLPLMKPAWMTLAILSIQSLWNATGGNFIYSESLKTLPVALSQIVSSGVARTGASAAITLCMMLVPIITFIISQNQVMETMSTSGMKD
ncbi:MAG: carbohydrate ABC transporter permease [Tyzzerella sp.]|nr:carbohydrate ABC transporter permease [Tyzzerella sp.]